MIHSAEQDPVPIGVAAPPRTMLAMRLVAPRRVEPERVATPVPARGQLLVRIEGCGVCASNGSVWEGRPWFEYPLEPGAPGHEAWGTVAAVGPDAEPGWLGRRVAMLSQHGFAEYDTVDAESAVPIPETLGHVPMPGEPVGCAMNVLRRSGIRAGDSVAVVGVGFLGAMLVRLAERAGARVVACSRRACSRDLAVRCGAVAVAPIEGVGALAEQLHARTGGLCDVVIEAGGVQETLDAACSLLDVRGRLVVAGYHQDGPRHVDMQMWNWNGIDVINAHERDPRASVRGMRDGLRAIAAGQIDLQPLITHALPMRSLGEAMSLLAERPGTFVKAVVTTGARR